MNVTSAWCTSSQLQEVEERSKVFLGCCCRTPLSLSYTGRGFVVRRFSVHGFENLSELQRYGAWDPIHEYNWAAHKDASPSLRRNLSKLLVIHERNAESEGYLVS